jgi:hypothetical protein
MPLFLPSLLFLAQALASDPLPSPQSGHQQVTARHHSRSAPTPFPAFRLTIVNATSVPSISLGISGTNNPPEYPRFPQGSWIEGAPRTERTLRLLAWSQDGIPAADRTLVLPARRQFLVVYGELCRNNAGETLAFQEPGKVDPTGSRAPNLQFRSYPVELVVKDPCHYRVVNAMPGKTLLLFSPAREGRAKRLLGVLTPGNSLLLTGQSPAVEWTAAIDGQEFPVSILQEGAAGNCIVPFFLKEGRPSFVRVFETP